MKTVLQLCAVVLFVVGGLKANAQERTVSGKITSSDDASPIPGVNVLVKGSINGTVTDIDGNYKLSVPASGGTLVFSFVGYTTQEVDISARSVIDVSLAADVTQLTEIVVTAVGVQSNKRALGYAVQGVDTKEIENSQQTNVVDALAGKATGVQINSSSGAPGASSAIRIRGNASINGDNSPLFVIDGVPIDNQQLATGNPDDASNQFLDGVANSNRAIDINPNDIESVTVLKGGAATALYGIRAGNGAIIITTKKGKNTDGKARVTFSASMGVNQITQMPGLQRLYSQGSGGVHSNPGNTSLPASDVNSGGRDRHSWGAPISDLRYENGTAGAYNWDKNGRLVLSSDPNASNQPANIYDNIGDFYRTGITYDLNLGLEVGNENVSYYFSVGQRKDEGVIPNTDFTRNSFKATMKGKLAQSLTSTTSVTFMNSSGNRAQQGSNLSGVMLGLLRTPATFDNSNGLGKDATNNRNAYMFADGTQRAYRGLSNFGTRTPQAIYDNPFFTVSENSFKDVTNRVIGFQQFDYKPLDWLDFTYRLGVDNYSTSAQTILAVGSLNLGNGEGFVADNRVNNTDLNSDLILHLNRDLSSDLNLNLLLGHNYYSHNTNRYYTQGVDLAIPDYYHITNTVTQLIRDVTTAKKTSAVYGDLTLSYKNYLFLGVTVRNEWSSTLPKENNSFLYPSGSLGFVFTDAFNMKSKVLTFGKLRGSYSILGNDALPYLTTTTFGVPAVADGWTTGINYPFNGVPAHTRNVVLGNPDLKPEKLTSIELGTDLRLLNDRIGLDLTVYKNLSTDQIIRVPIEPASGYRQVALNAGEVENKGIEVGILATPVTTNNFNWDINLNWTKNKSEVLALAPGVDVITLVGFSSTSSRAIVGKGYGALYGQDFNRTPEGEMIIGADGYPTLNPVSVFLGDPNPDWIMGITNAFSYKSFEFSFLFDIKQGGVMWNGTKGALTTMGTSISTVNRGEMHVFPGVLADGVTPNTQSVPLDETWYRGTGGGFSGNAVDFMEETSWYRLRNVTLTYRLGQDALNNSPFNGLSFSVSGNNLWFSTPYTGVDPETSLVGSGNGAGSMDYFNMPGVKSYTFSLRASF